MELIISIIAIVLSLIAIINERESLHDQAYDRFSQLWFGMDEVFIQHPEMHKYFYYDNNGEYASIGEKDDCYELAVCIAERFCDAFQYTAPLEKYLSRNDRKSYLKYKEMIIESPAVKHSHIVDEQNEFSWNSEQNKRDKRNSTPFT